MHQEIGLWATNASWKAQHPEVELDHVEGKALAGLMQKGWGVQEKFYDKSEGLVGELQLLLKDGQFEDSKWLCHSSVTSKVLHDPYRLS